LLSIWPAGQVGFADPSGFHLYAQWLMKASLADNCSALSTDVELAGSFQIEYSLPRCSILVTIGGKFADTSDTVMISPTSKCQPRILCVEPDPFVLETRCAVLKISGYDAASASPRGAGVVLSSQKFDLIVLSKVSDYEQYWILIFSQWRASAGAG
jgi:hypothetical protein